MTGGSLAYALTDWGLSLTASRRGLVLHEHEGLRKCGAGGSVRINPGAPGSDVVQAGGPPPEPRPPRARPACGRSRMRPLWRLVVRRRAQLHLR